MEKNFFNIDEIEGRLAYVFDNKQLLTLAFIHSSYFNENKHFISESNERLEFLGDAVLNLIVAEHLYSHFPKETEGKLSSLRSSIVDAGGCSKFCLKLGLDAYLLLGKGEKKQSKGKETILSDLFEAIMGAIYLDGGYDEARRFFFAHFKEDIEKILLQPNRNWKAELQEYIQKLHAEPPRYEVLDEWGLPHEKHFRIAVYIKQEKLGIGEGSSKKLAEQNAAQSALNNLKK